MPFPSDWLNTTISEGTVSLAECSMFVNEPWWHSGENAILHTNFAHILEFNRDGA